MDRVTFIIDGVVLSEWYSRIDSEIMNGGGQGGASIIMCVSKNHIEFRSWLGWELKRLEKTTIFDITSITTKNK